MGDASWLVLYSEPGSAVRAFCAFIVATVLVCGVTAAWTFLRRQGAKLVVECYRCKRTVRTKRAVRVGSRFLCWRCPRAPAV